MRHCEVNREHMAARAQGDFLAVTELADTLVRKEGLSFRLAHKLVHAAVIACGQYNRERMVDEVMYLAPEILGRSLNLAPAVLLEALDAKHFVAVRTIQGGPAPGAVLAEVDVTRKELAQAVQWLAEKQEQETAFPKKIESEKKIVLDPRR
jgi:argininosuccinate lyase